MVYNAITFVKLRRFCNNTSRPTGTRIIILKLYIYKICKCLLLQPVTVGYVVSMLTYTQSFH